MAWRNPEMMFFASSRQEGVVDRSFAKTKLQSKNVLEVPCPFPSTDFQRLQDQVRSLDLRYPLNPNSARNLSLFPELQGTLSVCLKTLLH